MIFPEEAMAAAARAIKSADDATFDGSEDEFLPTLTDIGAAELARAALEAAAPHLLAQALEDAASAASSDGLTTALEVIYDIRVRAFELRNQ